MEKPIVFRRCRFIKDWSYAVSLAVFFFFFFTFVYATLNSIASHSPQSLSETPCLLNVKAVNLLFKHSGRINMEMVVGRARRLLGGPGSWPPRCESKCGRCKPCKPVHVPVPPGTPVTAEYYPEAWRCKCGNKLYMP